MAEKISHPMASGWTSSENGIAIGTIVSHILVTLATLYLINPSMGLTPQEKIAAVGVLFSYITGSTGVSAFVTYNRRKLKEKALDRPDMIPTPKEPVYKTPEAELIAELLAQLKKKTG